MDMKIYDIPNEKLIKGSLNYNGAIIRFKNKLVLIYRSHKDYSKKSKIYFTFLDKNYQPIMKSKEIKIPNSSEYSVEDPRVFIFNGRLWMSYNCCSNFHNPRSWVLWVGCSELDRNFQPEKTYYFDYGGNIKNLRKNKKEEKIKPEKNWQFFDYNKKLHFVYKIRPHIVVQPSLSTGKKEKEYITELNNLWKYGELRGGTPPIRVGNEYFSFFHSSEVITIRKSRYYAGFYAFSAKPPFKITRISKEPVLMGDKGNLMGGIIIKYIVFPSGAIYDKGKWVVSYGYKDESIRIAEMSHEELTRKMVSVDNSIEFIEGINLKIHYLRIKIFHLFEGIDRSIDWSIGRIGIILKKIEPELYYRLKKIKKWKIQRFR